MLKHKYLLTILTYDPITGTFTWARPRPKIRVGAVAGYIKKNKGYRYIEIDGRAYSAHRLAWFYMRKKWPRKQIDHRDRDRANNRFSNLREATHGQNRANSKTTNKHGLKGIRYHAWLKENPWEAQIKRDGKVRSLGCYPTKEEAHQAYCVAAVELHGDFAHV